MRLRDYIVIKSEQNERLGTTNKVLKMIAAKAGVSVHTLHSISTGRRFASAEVAEKISNACDGHVKPRELMNHDRKKPGPKAGSRIDRARAVGKVDQPAR